MASTTTSSLGVWQGAWGYVGGIIFLGVLASVTVALRFWARRLSGLGASSDDWLALFALLVHHGLGALVIVAFLQWGVGFDLPVLLSAAPWASVEQLKLMFITTVLYGTASTSIRLSVIIFFLRIFPTPIVKRGAYALTVLCIAWFITVEGLYLGMCRPIAYMWDSSIKGGTCLDVKWGIIIPAIFNVIIDAATVLLPIREVMKLHLSKEKKLFIIGIFCIGGLATGASLARLVAISLYLNRPPNGANQSPALLIGITTIEIYIAIIAACAPALVPVYKKVRGIQSPDGTLRTHRTGYSIRPTDAQSRTHLTGGSKPTLNRSTRRDSEDEERFFKRIEEPSVLYPSRDREFWTDISARPGSEAIPMEGIRVQRDVTWNSED
ncbi:hypothetical protein NPX13_g2060 [Xylaria arbuscula]|uniref:Rhodopsin domain-containing protein n=1 Tax=Xylaria arbuscula TaxID=114810 RepID=A0A9W8NKI1_9PEZI|nr:hypothetical protein NPX13_g2060 [Xylaria arbuscula]